MARSSDAKYRAFSLVSPALAVDRNDRSGDTLAMQPPSKPSGADLSDMTTSATGTEGLLQRAAALGLTLSPDFRNGVDTNIQLLMGHHANLLKLMAAQSGEGS